MKKLLLLALLTASAASAHAADPQINPYVKDSVGLMNPGMPGQTGTVPAIQPGTMASAQAAPLLEQVPPAFTENRNIFDSLAVVGLSQSHATLRYPMVGAAQTGPTMNPSQGMPGAPGAAAMQSQSFRVLTVKDGDPVWLAGRRYTVKKEGDTVQILSGKGKSAEVVWIGQLEAPRSFTAPPPAESPVGAVTTGAHAMGTVTPGAPQR